MSNAAPTETCDVCLRPKPPKGADADRFDGWLLVDIEAELGLGKLCWSRASGPCVSIGWERVRTLEGLIRSAIAERVVS